LVSTVPPKAAESITQNLALFSTLKQVSVEVVEMIDGLAF